MNTTSLSDPHPDQFEFSSADEWISSKFQLVAIDVNRSFNTYRFDQVAQSLYGFIWGDFCNWYLEIAKIQLADKSKTTAQHIGTQITLLEILDGSLRLLHPLMPFITEALWKETFSQTEQLSASILKHKYPKGELTKVNKRALSEIGWVQEVISSVRTMRGEMHIEPNRRITVLLQSEDNQVKQYVKQFASLLITMGRLDSLEQLSNNIQPPEECATTLVGKMKIYVPLGSTIDREIELERLTREIGKLTRELVRSNAKLQNKNFIAKAPEEVVKKQEERVKNMEHSIEELRKQQARVEKL